MTVMVEKIAAVTLWVADMRRSVRLYGDVLGMGGLFSGGEMRFSLRFTPRTPNAPILNLEQGRSVPGWGRMIFDVADVDAFWEYLRGKGLHPESPRDASWGERYFHMSDPDGHELSSGVRSSSLPPVARTHPEEKQLANTHAQHCGRKSVRDGNPGMKQDSGYVPGS